MSERKYYVLCDSNCKFESMTKEQILTAIAQAVESGEIRDVDTGFVTTLKTINGTPLRFFAGTQAEYEALTDEEKVNLYAIITNDTTVSAITEAIEAVKASCEGLQTALTDGTFTVKNATNAENASVASKLSSAWNSLGEISVSFGETINSLALTSNKTYIVEFTALLYFSYTFIISTKGTTTARSNSVLLYAGSTDGNKIAFLQRTNGGAVSLRAFGLDGTEYKKTGFPFTVRYKELF